MWTYICSIAVMLFLHSDYLGCSGTLGLAYIRGVFFSRIYVTDPHRDTVSEYFGKRGVTSSLCRIGYF